MQKKENNRRFIFIHSQCKNDVQNKTYATWTSKIKIGVSGHLFLRMKLVHSLVPLYTNDDRQFSLNPRRPTTIGILSSDSGHLA